MPTPHIPQEILDKLVDYLSLEHDSLKSLTLTSPRFVHRSQSYLYRTLHIDLKVTQGKRNILDRNPSLIKLVRELRLTFDFTVPPAHALGRAESQFALSRIVNELQGIETLLLHSFSPVDWSDVSPICQCLISNLLSHPLHKLSLVGFARVPPSLVSPTLINTVETCELRHATLASIESQETTLLRIKTLQCAGPSIASVARMLSTGFTLDNLVDLQIAVTNDTFTARERASALQLISQTSHRFKSLALEYPYHFLSEFSVGDLAGDDLSLPSMPGLRYLRVHVKSCRMVSHDSYAIDPCMARLLHAILSGNPQPTLEIFDLLISWRSYSIPPFSSLSEPPIRLLKKDPLNRSWDMIDEVLSDPAVFPELRGVRVTPNIEYPPFVLKVLQPDPIELKAFIHIVPRLFHLEMMAALEAVRTRLSVFDTGGETQVGKAFVALKESVLARAEIGGDGI